MRPVDQAVLLSADRVVVHHCEKDTAKRVCAEEEEMVDDGNGNGISRRSQVMMRQAQHHQEKLPISCSMDP